MIVAILAGLSVKALSLSQDSVTQLVTANGQWWKGPILYGGMAADIYGIVWNQKRFKEYRDAYVEWVQYLDAKAKDPDTPYPQNPAWDKIPKAFDVETDPYLQTSRGQTWFKNTLSNRKTSFKRNRDLFMPLILSMPRCMRIFMILR